MRFFNSAAQFGLSPDVISYNTLLKSLITARRMELVLKYFIDMIADDITPQVPSRLIFIFGIPLAYSETLSYDYVRRVSKEQRYKALISHLQKAADRQQYLPELREFLGAASERTVTGNPVRTRVH